MNHTSHHHGVTDIETEERDRMHASGARAASPPVTGDQLAHRDRRRTLNRIAFSATVHCLAGCAVGEVAGMAIGTSLGMSNASTIVLAIMLAFISGYAWSLLALTRSGLSVARALRVALAADTVSILIMEAVDNAVMLAIPGAMNATLSAPLFWASLVAALVAAGIAAFPVNRWLIARGRGHALAHAHHG